MIKRTTDLKKFIVGNYPIPPEKFTVIRLGNRTFMYLVTKKCTLEREIIFEGPIDAIEDNTVLLNYLKENIEKTLKKYKYSIIKNN